MKYFGIFISIVGVYLLSVLGRAFYSELELEEAVVRNVETIAESWHPNDIRRAVVQRSLMLSRDELVSMSNVLKADYGELRAIDREKVECGLVGHLEDKNYNNAVYGVCEVSVRFEHQEAMLKVYMIKELKEWRILKFSLF